MDLHRGTAGHNDAFKWYPARHNSYEQTAHSVARLHRVVIELPGAAMRETSPFATEAARAFASAALAALAAALALRLGLQHLPRPMLPQGLSRLPSQVDPGVVLLFVPLCALMLAMLAEAVRLIHRGALPDEAPPHARAIAHWQDGGA